MSGDLWPEGRAILKALREMEASGTVEPRTDKVAERTGLDVESVHNHAEHLRKADYVECLKELGQKLWRLRLTDAGRAAA